jgi:hypothetical protein
MTAMAVAERRMVAAWSSSFCFSTGIGESALEGRASRIPATAAAANTSDASPTTQGAPRKPMLRSASPGSAATKPERPPSTASRALASTSWCWPDTVVGTSALFVTA